jgi:hypothetical protein
VENGTLRQAQGPGKWGNGEERKWESGQEQQYVESETQKVQRDDIIIAEKKSDSENLIVAFDNCLIAPEVELVMPALDIIAPPAPARVSERLDSLNAGVNCRQIILEQQREAEYNFLFEKHTNSKRDPLAKFDIAKSFLTGISAILLGVVLILLSAYEGSVLIGLLPFGVVIAIIGLVIVIVAAIRADGEDLADPRFKTRKRTIGLFKRRFWKL